MTDIQRIEQILSPKWWAENCESNDVQPTKEVGALAKNFLETARLNWRGVFPEPTMIYPDEQGGLKIRWTNFKKHVLLWITLRPQESVLFWWNDGDVFDEGSFVIGGRRALLITKLVWLNT